MLVILIGIIEISIIAIMTIQAFDPNKYFFKKFFKEKSLKKLLKACPNVTEKCLDNSISFSTNFSFLHRMR